MEKEHADSDVFTDLFHCSNESLVDYKPVSNKSRKTMKTITINLNLELLVVGKVCKGMGRQQHFHIHKNTNLQVKNSSAQSKIDGIRFITYLKAYP